LNGYVWLYKLDLTTTEIKLPCISYNFEDLRLFVMNLIYSYLSRLRSNAVMFGTYTCADFEMLQHHYRRLQKRSSADDDVTLVMGSSSTVAATVGSNRILECEIRYPSDTKIYIEHIITWRKQGTEVLLMIFLLALIFFLARSANLPEGLSILLALISFFSFF